MKAQIWITGAVVLSENGKEKVADTDEYIMHALVDSDLIEHETLRVELEATKEKEEYYKGEFKKLVLEAIKIISDKEIDSFYDEEQIKQ